MPVLTERDATASDHAAFARLFPGLGVPDPLPGPERFAEELVPGTFFLCRGDEVVAYAWVALLEGDAHVRHVVVAEEARGQGVGKQVMAAIARRLRARGILRWRLNVKPDNEPALRLYRSFGMAEQHRSKAMRLPWASVSALPPSPPSAARPVGEGEGPAIEAALGMAKGLVAAMAGPGDVRHVLTEGERIVGYARFAPTFPGSYPFRPSSPAYARALLESLRPHALPSQPPYVQIFVEGDPALAAVLHAAGATTVLETLQLAGDVPEP